MIMKEVNDPDSLRQCCLSGPDLLPYARRVFFTHVKLFIGPDGSNNLDAMLECYSTRPYAQYARSLVVKYRGEPDKASYLLHEYPKLQKVITLLSTYLQDCDSYPIPLPQSKISSLTLDGVSVSEMNFKRIIRAFPAITTLRWNIKQFDKGDKRSDRLSRRLLRYTPLQPQIRELEIMHAGLSNVASVLFPLETPVRLRSLNLHRCDNPALWSSVVRRAGRYLKELTVSEMKVRAFDGKCAFDYSGGSLTRTC